MIVCLFDRNYSIIGKVKLTSQIFGLTLTLYILFTQLRSKS